LANLRQIEFAGKTLLTPQCTLARSPNGGWDGKGFGMWHELQVAYGVWRLGYVCMGKRMEMFMQTV